MKKLFYVLLPFVLILCLVACGSEAGEHGTQNTESTTKQESPYNKPVREEWDVYASLDCFVKTEYNQNDNPVKRELYSNETFEKGFVLRYEYDMDGKLASLFLDAKASSSVTQKDARFALSVNEKNGKTEAEPLFNNEYEMAFSWDEDGKLASEEWESPEFDVAFFYDKTGNVTKEKSADLTAYLVHRYGDDKSAILVTEAGALTEKLTLTFGEGGMPAEVTTPEFAMHYTYNEKQLCTLIETQVAGQTFGKMVITYNDNGDPVTSDVTAIALGVEAAAARCEYTYDQNGNLTRETVYGVNNKLELKITADRAFAYDARGRLIKETEGIYPNLGKLTNNRITEYEYDEDGNKIKLTQIVCIPSGKITKDKAIICYTAEGRLCSATAFEFHSNGTVSQTVENEYNENEKLVKATQFNYYIGEKVNGELVDGPLHQKSVMEQQPNGKKIKETLEKYEQNGWCTYQLERLYYENGKKKSEVSQESGNSKSGTTKYSADYYENGKLKRTEKRYIASSGRLTRVTVCTYDENGKLIEEKDERYQ